MAEKLEWPRWWGRGSARRGSEQLTGHVSFVIPRANLRRAPLLVTSLKYSIRRTLHVWPTPTAADCPVTSCYPGISTLGLSIIRTSSKAALEQKVKAGGGSVSGYLAGTTHGILTEATLGQRWWPIFTSLVCVCGQFVYPNCRGDLAVPDTAGWL